MKRINPKFLMPAHELVNFGSKLSKYISLSLKVSFLQHCWLVVVTMTPKTTITCQGRAILTDVLNKSG